jgi:hypothetical protein
MQFFEGHKLLAIKKNEKASFEKREKGQVSQKHVCNAMKK